MRSIQAAVPGPEAVPAPWNTLVRCSCGPKSHQACYTAACGLTYRLEWGKSKRCIAKWLQHIKCNAALKDADSSIHTNCNSSQATARGACLMQFRGERKRVWLIMWAIGACESCRKLLHRRPWGIYLISTDSKPCGVHNNRNSPECPVTKSSKQARGC